MRPVILDRELLAKSLGLLGSSHDGERLAAAAVAERLRANAGMTWFEILATPAFPAPRREPVDRGDRDRGDDGIDIALALELCRENSAMLSVWEKKFLRSIAEQHRRRGLSAKQIAVLARIARGIAATVRQARSDPPRKPRRKRRRAA
jgi:hypothetical protein